MKRQLHLNLFIHSRGHHEASWRHPASSPLSLTDIRYYQDLAQRAEAALLDSIFLADQLALGGDVAQAPRTWLEPITVLAAVAVATSRVGLIATASTTYTEPFNLARQFASIDHISNGRAAWNIVTSWLATAAENYGGAGQVSHADRYARGEEFMEVVKELWDSWAAEAVIDDRAAGVYARGDRIRSIKHRGDFYDIDAARRVGDQRPVIPTIPQPLDHIDKLLGALVAQLVVHLAVEVEVERRLWPRAGDDIPGGAALADMVDRGEQARYVVGFGKAR